MNRRKALFVGFAIGLLALGGWKALSHFKTPSQTAVAEQWVCPMRCLNKLYEHAGECDVCHMKLVPYKAKPRKLTGYSCPLHRSDKVFSEPGTCPFCGLKLKENFDGPPPPHKALDLRLWPEVDGKTAIYCRPFQVKSLRLDHLLRGAGELKGLRLSLHLDPEKARALKRGASAMVMPPQGYARPVQASVEKLGPRGLVVLKLSRPIVGAGWALAEIRVEDEAALAVPLSALKENGPLTQVYLKTEQGYQPRQVTVTARGESYASVRGLKEGDTVAGAGIFWLDAQWRMDHP